MNKSLKYVLAAAILCIVSFSLGFCSARKKGECSLDYARVSESLTKPRYDMIGLFVEDMPKMVGFYRDVMGFGIKNLGGDSYVEFDSAGVRFSMYARKELPELLGQTPTYPDGLNGTFELVVNVHERENVDRLYAKAIAGGAKPVYAPRDEPWKIRSAMVADPDGNLIEIMSDFWK